MKVTKLFKPKQFSGLDEIKLSVLIHVAALLVLSVIFMLRQADAKPAAKKVVPVKLIAASVKPRVAAGKKPEKKNQAQKAKGTSKKLVKKTPKKPAPVKKIVKAKKAKKPASKPTAKKAQVAAKPKKAQPKPQPVKKNPAPVKTETPATTNKPAVVQKNTSPVAPVRPVHNTPTFEAVGYLASGKSNSTPLNSEISGYDMSAPIESILPDSFLEDEKAETKPDEFVPMPTGVKEGKNADASGLFEIGAIESFGGNGENFSAPGIVSKVLPDYPEWARKSGSHGSAVYRVLIQQSGTVGDVVTMSSTIDPKLAINGAQALRRWVFTPVLQNGEPQETWVKITVQYKLN
jgi:TonB family protein